MQVIGGKQKSGGAQIARTINGTIARHGASTFVEPFCGGLSVTTRVVAPTRLASDACESLITLYTAMQGGWVPPTELDREQWARLRAAKDPGDPLTAFAGFGCSFQGRWFSSYAARYKFTKRWVPAAEAAAQSLVKKLAACKDVAFRAGDYRDAPSGDVTYADPPYEGTMGFDAIAEPWDPNAFWAWAACVAQRGLICVSEQQAPAGWVPIWSLSVQRRIATGTGSRRVDHLFVPEAQVGAWSADAPAPRRRRARNAA